MISIVFTNKLGCEVKSYDVGKCSFNSKMVDSIYFEGDDWTNFFYSKNINIPTFGNRNSQIYYGDLAKFIVANYINAEVMNK